MAQILYNTYEILDLLGKGGMSTVFKARHIRLDTVVAIKAVRKDQAVDLQAEVHILKRLNHPNLVRVLDVFEDDRLIYIVMDYIEGEDLEHVIRREKRIPEEKVREWSVTLAEVLGYLHSRIPPIIYRDMKPSNVILQKDGTLKLIDFGIAREFKANASGDTTYMGTTGFAAPEQFGMAQSDSRTDIYSLGMTMYYLATGKSPAEPPYTYVPARELNPEVSENLEKILEKCVRYDPDERYQDTGELLRDLRSETVQTQKFSDGRHEEEDKRVGTGPSGPGDDGAGKMNKKAPGKRRFPWGLVRFTILIAVIAGIVRYTGGINIQLEEQNIITFELPSGYYSRKQISVPNADLSKIQPGITVHHDEFGDGTVRALDEGRSRIYVDFAGGEQWFMYPEDVTCGSLTVVSYKTDGTETGLPQDGNAGIMTYHIGISLYCTDTFFMDEYKEFLVRGFSEQCTDTEKYIVTILSSENDVSAQAGQIDRFIAAGMDLIILNPVRPGSADDMIGKIRDAGIPLILTKREPQGTDGFASCESIISDPGVCYIGVDPREEGMRLIGMIGGLPGDGDINGDGKLSYLMIESDLDEPDAQYRTQYALESLASSSLETECLECLSGSWDKAGAEKACRKALKKYGDRVEAVICSDYFVTAGASSSVTESGRTIGEDIFIFQFNGTSSISYQMLREGVLTGIVNCSDEIQARTAAMTAREMLRGNSVSDYIWCTCSNLTEKDITD